MTSVSVAGMTHTMFLPVMDQRNNQVKNPSTTDINKTLMRCLTKNIALHGIGLYPYMGEDVPQDPDAEQRQTSEKKSAPAKKTAAKKSAAKGGISKLERKQINDAGAAAVKRDKANNDKVKAIYEKYNLVGSTPPAADLDHRAVVAELNAL